MNGMRLQDIELEPISGDHDSYIFLSWTLQRIMACNLDVPPPKASFILPTTCDIRLIIEETPIPNVFSKLAKYVSGIEEDQKNSFQNCLTTCLLLRSSARESSSSEECDVELLTLIVNTIHAFLVFVNTQFDGITTFKYIDILTLLTHWKRHLDEHETYDAYTIIRNTLDVIDKDLKPSDCINIESIATFCFVSAEKWPNHPVFGANILVSKSSPFGDNDLSEPYWIRTDRLRNWVFLGNSLLSPHLEDVRRLEITSAIDFTYCLQKKCAAALVFDTPTYILSGVKYDLVHLAYNILSTTEDTKIVLARIEETPARRHGDMMNAESDGCATIHQTLPQHGMYPTMLLSVLKRHEPQIVDRIEKSGQWGVDELRWLRKEFRRDDDVRRLLNGEAFDARLLTFLVAFGFRDDNYLAKVHLPKTASLNDAVQALHSICDQDNSASSDVDADDAISAIHRLQASGDTERIDALSKLLAESQGLKSSTYRGSSDFETILAYLRPESHGVGARKTKLRTAWTTRPDPSPTTRSKTSSTPTKNQESTIGITSGHMSELAAKLPGRE